ncbi:MAG: nuclear transport factor 2 family protein [Flavobacteriales bacterium]
MPLLERFYLAFAARDVVSMNALYHPEARFHDPVFRSLDAREVRAMWAMLLSQGRDLHVTYKVLQEDDSGGEVHWEARYTFSTTGRPVHNRISAAFTFRDGLIHTHRDTFSLWRWSRQALGASGLLLGWSPLIANAVHRKARKALDRQLQRVT